VKPLPKALLGLYLLVLLWLVLFKLSLDFSGIWTYQLRSINLVPFAGYSRANPGEMIDNFIAFVPLGLLLGLNFKRTSFGRNLGPVFALSFAVEVTQFALAIGVSDITDVIMNTLGGLVGLVLYGLSRRYIHNEKLDRFIVIVGTVLLIALVLFRFLVMHVRYRSAPAAGVPTQAGVSAMPLGRAN